MDKTLAEKMRAYVAEHKEEILGDLTSLAKIPSVRGESENGAPFGRKCVECLEAVCVAAMMIAECDGILYSD